MKDTHLYDSSMKSQGFSGYSAEVLIDYFDTFDGVIDFFANMKDGAMVDKNETFVPNQSNEKNKFHLIDPIDKNRDLITAFSPMKIGRTIKTAQYWQEHGESPYKIEDNGKPSKMPSTKMDSVTVSYQNTQVNEETLVGQSRSSQISLINKLETAGFGVRMEKESVNGINVDYPRSKMNNPFKEDGEAKIKIGVDSLTIPPTYERELNPKANIERVKEGGKKVITRDGKNYSIETRKWTDVADAIEYYTKTDPKASGMKEGTKKDMANGVKISTKENDTFENMF